MVSSAGNAGGDGSMMTSGAILACASGRRLSVEGRGWSGPKGDGAGAGTVLTERWSGPETPEQQDFYALTSKAVEAPKESGTGLVDRTPI